MVSIVRKLAIKQTNAQIFSQFFPAPKINSNDRNQTKYDIEAYVVTEMPVIPSNQNVVDKVLLYVVSGVVGGSVFLLMLVGGGFFIYKYVVSRKQHSITQSVHDIVFACHFVT